MKNAVAVDGKRPGAGVRWLTIIVGVAIALVGLYLAGAGGYLAVLGGSWYFVLCGLATLGAGVLIAKGNPNGVWLFGVILLLSVIWAIWETGL